MVKAFDSAGKEIDSPNIGRQIVWDMVAYDDGLYDDGKIYSPTATRPTTAKCN